MIKLLLDMGLPRRSARDLADQGWDVHHVGDIGMARAADDQIAAHAHRENRVVVTLDRDFSRLVALGNVSVSVVHLRLPKVTRESVVVLLGRLLPDIEEDLETGAVVSVAPDGVRIRRLPLR